MLETTHKIKTIKYPDIIFFCISSYEQTQARAKCYNSNSWEAELSKEAYDMYSSKFKEAYQIISVDAEFTKHSKILLVDEPQTTSIDTWNKYVRSELHNT